MTQPGRGLQRHLRALPFGGMRLNRSIVVLEPGPGARGSIRHDSGGLRVGCEFEPSRRTGQFGAALSRICFQGRLRIGRDSRHGRGSLQVKILGESRRSQR